MHVHGSTASRLKKLFVKADLAIYGQGCFWVVHVHECNFHIQIKKWISQRWWILKKEMVSKESDATYIAIATIICDPMLENQPFRHKN